VQNTLFVKGKRKKVKKKGPHSHNKQTGNNMKKEGKKVENAKGE